MINSLSLLVTKSFFSWQIDWGILYLNCINCTNTRIIIDVLRKDGVKLINIDYNSNKAIYEQIYDEILKLILTNVLKPENLVIYLFIYSLITIIINIWTNIWRDFKVDFN